MQMPLRILLTAAALILLTGCTGGGTTPSAEYPGAAPQPPPQPQPQVQEETGGEALPTLPVLEHPAQLIFRSDSGGAAEVKSNGKLLLLRGPHSASFNASLERSILRVSGVGSGKLVLASDGGDVIYFSRLWVTGIRSPSFAILPGSEAVFLRYGGEVEYPLRVVPVGNFKGEVRLSAKSSTPAVVAYISDAGVPPFNATLKLRARGLAGDGEYIRIVGVSGKEKVESYIRINNPVKKESGLLSAIFKLIWIALLPLTLTLSLALGIISGITVGGIGLAAVLSNPITFLTPTMVEMIALGPSTGVAVTQQILEHYAELSPMRGVTVEGGSLKGVGTLAVANSTFKVLLPRVELSPAVGQEVVLPLYIAGSGEVRLNVSTPAAIEAKIEPSAGVAPFRAKLKLLAKREAPKRGFIIKRTREYVVTVAASSGGVQEIYRLYVKPQRRDYDVKLSSDLVYVEPGSYAAVSAVVMRNNRFAPEEYTPQVAAPPGIEVFVEPERGRTPFVANITLHAKSVEPGRYDVRIGSAALRVVVGRKGYAVVTPAGVGVSQGTGASLQVEIYSLREISFPLRVELPLNYSISRQNAYQYTVDVMADRYTPPGIYRGRVVLGDNSAPFQVTVTGSPVVVEHETQLNLGRGETAQVELRFVPAGYSGRIALNVSATPGIAVEPQLLSAEVPGSVLLRVQNVQGSYGSVHYYGEVMYNGTRYGVSGTIGVAPG